MILMQYPAIPLGKSTTNLLLTYIQLQDDILIVLLTRTLNTVRVHKEYVLIIHNGTETDTFTTF